MFVWWKLDKSFFNLEKDIYVCSVYIPPSNSTFYSSYKGNDPFDELQQQISFYSRKGDIILTGDFNSRKGNLEDLNTNYNDPHWENLMHHNLFSKINLPKLRSQDKFINTYGRKLVEICHNSDLCFLNGRTTGDRLGKPTCYTFNGFSIVDYTLVSAQLYNRFLNFNVHNLDYFSSHCAISFTLITNIFSIESNVNNCSLSSFPDTFKWSAEHDHLFQKLVNSYFVNSNITAKIDGILETTTQDSIDLATETLTNKIKILANKCFKLKKTKKKRKKVKTNKKWFDRSCIESKRLLTEAAKNLTRYPKDPIVRGRYHTVKKEHKQLIKKKELQFKECLLDKINNLQANNPKEYWAIVNRLKEAKQDNTIDNIDPLEWYQWFKSLNTKESQKNNKEFREKTINSRKEALFC